MALKRINKELTDLGRYVCPPFTANSRVYGGVGPAGFFCRIINDLITDLEIEII